MEKMKKILGWVRLAKSTENQSFTTYPPAYNPKYSHYEVIITKKNDPQMEILFMACGETEELAVKRAKEMTVLMGGKNKG